MSTIRQTQGGFLGLARSMTNYHTKSPPGFNYCMVPLSQGQIRLLCLPEQLPSESDPTSLVYRLISISLDDHVPEYTALSYVWGDPSQKAKILVNDLEIVITKSLERALKSLDVRTPGRMLWVDQLCINQRDDQEKASQIPMMRQIYSKSASTIAWLGEEDQESDAAMEYLKGTGTAAINAGIKDISQYDAVICMKQSKLCQETREATNTSKEDDALNILEKTRGLMSTSGDITELPILPAVLSLFNRNYFTRGWVVQEVAIPETIVFQCGSKSIQENTFVAAVVLYYIQFRLYISRYLQMLQHHAEIGKVLQVTEKHIMLISHMEPLVPMLRARLHYHDPRERINLTMISLQRRFSMKTTNFTKPVDRILGFLGLAIDAENIISPNNADNIHIKSLEEVYTLVTGRMCRNGDFSVLEHVQFPKSSSRLPSWVPDFQRPQYPRLRSATQAPIGGKGMPFTAGGNRQPDISSAEHAQCVDESNQSLSFPILVIDKIEKTTTAIKNLEDPWAIFKLAQKIGDFCKLSRQLQENVDNKIYRDPERALEAPWRILVFDREPVDGSGSKQRATTGVTGTAYSQWIDTMSFKKPFTAESNRFMGRLHQLEGKSGFLSESGFVGFGQSAVKPGDFLCVAPCLSVPFVLRRRTGSIDGVFQFMGESYCDGIMDGEAWDMGYSMTNATLDHSPLVTKWSFIQWILSIFRC